MDDFLPFLNYNKILIISETYTNVNGKIKKPKNDDQYHQKINVAMLKNHITFDIR